MNLFAFELGRKRHLCFSELIAFLGEKNLVEKNIDTAIFKLDLVDPQALQSQLGGTIKIMEILDRPALKNLKPAIQKVLESQFRNHKGKVSFAINTLNFKRLRDINIKELLNFSKKILKSLGINSRFINKDFKNTPPSAIFKSKIIKKGIDLNIIRTHDGLALGKTVTIQNIDSYSLRDYSKPKRDPHIGMLPPKLAQILINLAGPDTSTIYDPFCGTGTVLTEGLLMKKEVVGSDISSKLVDYSKTNCEWLEREFGTTHSYRIFEKNAREISQKSIPEKIDAIITEGYLGPALSSPPSPEKIKEIFAELTDLHKNWLKAVHSATSKNCKIVMCKTAYRIGEKIEHFPEFEEIAQSAGYRVTDTFTYDRPDQIVIRDIAILEKI